MTAGRILAIDTSGTNALVALGDADGTLLAERRWIAGYRHGEELLTRIDETLVTTGVALTDLSGIVVGTGPGAFTGLRVGLATAKGLSHGLATPIAGVATSEALLLAASRAGEQRGTQAALLLPAGPSDRVVVFEGRATLLRGGEEPDLEPGTTVVAVDLPDRASPEALAMSVVSGWCHAVRVQTTNQRATLAKRRADVAGMFDNLASRYDLINDVASLGLDWCRST